MKNGEERELTIGEFFDLAQKEGGRYEIETPEGWKSVGSLVKKRNKECLRIGTDKEQILEGSTDHYVLVAGRWKPLAELNLDDLVETKLGQSRVTVIEKLGHHDTLDLEVLSTSHSYYSNGIVSHNTGKSSLARAVAQQLDLPIVTFDLASFSNDEFVREWKSLLTYTPCVALIEDVDNVFHGRENALGEEGGGLTFDCLLNCLSGVEQADGVLTIVTTNRIEMLDEALLRPGRVDRKIELGLMDEDCRRQVASRILKQWPELIKETVEAGGGSAYDSNGFETPGGPKSDTPAEFTDRCCQIALAKYWEDKVDGVELSDDDKDVIADQRDSKIQTVLLRERLQTKVATAAEIKFHIEQNMEGR